MFGVIPSWMDMLGAGLVLGTICTITFEKQITAKMCSFCRPPDKPEKKRKKSLEEVVTEKVKEILPEKGTDTGAIVENQDIMEKAAKKEQEANKTLV